MKAVKIFGSIIMSIVVLTMTGCGDEDEDLFIISPPLSGKPFVTKYLLADEHTRFEHVRVITNTFIGKILILSDPSSVGANTYYDIRSKDPAEANKYAVLRELNGDDQVHKTWAEMETGDTIPYPFCFAEAMVSIDITCDKDYRTGYRAGSSLNDLFSVKVHKIGEFIQEYDKDKSWGWTYYYKEGELLQREGVMMEDFSINDWNAAAPRSLVPLIPMLISNQLPDTAGAYSFTVMYKFEDGSTASFKTDPMWLHARN